MKRTHRSTLAAETVAICQAGHYTAPGGTEVQLASTIRDAERGTVLCSPESRSHAFAR